MASTTTPSELFGRREDPARDLASQAGAVAEACHAMAVRFHQGGTLITFGAGGASADAQHVAVEFVHPVIVGKVALPALSLTADVATLTQVAERDGFDQVFARQIRALARPGDIALGIGDGPSVREGLAAANELGLLTVALASTAGPAAGAPGPAARNGNGHGPVADHVLVAASEDPRVAKEIHVTMYHVLWELVHVFFEQPGVLT